MTTLFNLFCPLVWNLNISSSLGLMILLNLTFVLMLVTWFFLTFNLKLAFLFGDQLNSMVWVGLFVFLAALNLFSLSLSSFPSTTVLIFNFFLATFSWMSSLFFLLMNKSPFYLFAPLRAPWYLIFFLVFIEVISMLVRPLTLCFRLMANMSAGHILLSLITKLPFGLWLVGSAFGILELMVCVVQGYVFALLVKVYTEEYI